MRMLSFIARLLLARRLLGAGRSRAHHRRQGAHHPGGYGGYANRYGGRSRRAGGFGLFSPFPYYSRRTRGGARVSVGGCCLPIPLALSVVLASLGRAMLLRR